MTSATHPRRIAIATGAPLAFNPRALKEATALARAGYEVTVLGSRWNEEQFERDTGLASNRGFAYEGFGSLGGRLRTRLGKEAFGLMNMQNRWQLGPLVSHLHRRAASMRADYSIVHLEQAMWAGQEMLRAGKPTGIDMEDWYSEDLLPAARQDRPLALLRSLERTLLQGASHATCPSQAMSARLSSTYGCAAPTVLYNAFPWSDRDNMDRLRKDRGDRGVSSIHWVSQVMGPGRGLEDLFGALPLIRGPVEIHLRATRAPGFDAWFQQHVAPEFRDRVFLHDPVEPAELLSRIAEHDIGFAGEMKYCASKDLTVSNKMLHYLLGGCAVVASDTAGQREVASMARGAVCVYPSGDAQALARAVNDLIETPGKLIATKGVALQAAKDEFCWERQEPKLLDAVAGAFSRQASRAK
jgi:glycosyltransferase involved in cell wall biosynthesis